MHVEVLVLSPPTVESCSWTTALKARGFRTRICGEWPEAHRLVVAGTSSVILYDSDARIGSPDDVLEASRSAGLPAIVMVRELNAEKWMSLFRKGAYDVLRHSVETKHLCDSVEEAINNSRSRGWKRASWSRSLLDWTRSKLLANALNVLEYEYKEVDGSKKPG